MLGIEIVLLLWVHAANEAGKWYWGIPEAAERFMARWHVDEENKRLERRPDRMRDTQRRNGVERVGNRCCRQQEGGGRQGRKASGRRVRKPCLRNLKLLRLHCA